MREWWEEWWPGVVLVAVLVIVLTTMIVLSVTSAERFLWLAADCTATGVRDGQPVYECVGVPK
jgi:hypothetical protein